MTTTNGTKKNTTAPARKSKTGETKSKRTGKQAPVVSVSAECGDDIVRAQSDDENIVLNLKVFNDESEDDDSAVQGFNEMLDCDCDFLGKPFDMTTNESFLDTMFPHTNGANCDNSSDIASEVTSCCATYKPSMHSNLKVIDLLKDFEEKNKHNEWPSNTSIHCYWCCHKFNNTPFGIPVKYANERFQVYGCFCSLECCAAYNMDSKDASDDIWERSSLINMLSRKLGYKNFIKPAPSRLALNIFGGHMDIDEFRSYCISNKVINVNFPPMMTITQQIEEINEADVNSDYRYIPIDTDRINKYKEKIKLKRQKPITNFKNTLDHTMNLKYGI